ncbi:hypothetical protein niasHT_004014 [Heterodera trifolii]|uniref:Metalloendopeptidase n=1 Tax=Heterodera trifolii TaxID=157864 RepID=A0ABD2LW03_9BILA
MIRVIICNKLLHPVPTKKRVQFSIQNNENILLREMPAQRNMAVMDKENMARTIVASSADPLSSDVGIWKTCNGKNGIIMVENACTKLLICYQSEMAKNKKIGKRIGVGKGNTGKQKFVECAEEIAKDQWHGLIITKHQDGVISYESRQFEIEKYFKNMNLKLKLSHGFDDILGTEQIKETEKYLEINLTKNAEPLGNELQEALSSAAFFDDFMPFVLAFEFGTTFCAENGGTTKLCKEKCLSQSLVTQKTKAPTKFNGTTTTFGIVPTTEQTFGFVPFVRHVNHFGMNCTNIFFPTEVDKFLLNITARPYEIACNDYGKRAKIYEPIPSGYWSDGRFVNACMAVPSEKCEKHVELYACYKSIGNKPSVNAIGELCQKHLNNATNAAGFAVQICAHRHQTEATNELINDGIGSILKNIAPQMVNGTLAKMIHFVPPSNDYKIRAFFQIERPKFSKFITNRTKLLPYQNDPNKFDNPDPCDKYGTDCVPVRNLLLKIEALANCGKNESENNAIFEMPKWAPPLPPHITLKKPSETLICEGDLFCDKRRLREQYNRLREICGLQPEKVESQRKKRQYNPFEKWTENPIKIAFNKDALPDKYGLWDNAIKAGAKLIEEVTCVRFEFVDEMVDGENGIKIEDTLTACGWSHVGRVGGWQFLQLGMHMFGCINYLNMSVVAGHELLHALGFKHEQSRSDGRNYVILRKNDGYSKIDPNTQNFGFAYDFGSVMHYGAGGNHEQGLYDRITLPRFYQQTIGQRERISFKDAAIINQIYCNDSCNGTEDKCQNGGYLNPNDCTKCHCPDGYGGEYCKELEENFNCEDLSVIPRELPDVGKKARIQFKSLSNLFECTYNCSSAYVEVKYRADKRAQGAKLCCPRALTDLNANEYKNWIEAENPDTDIVISARLSPKWTVPSTVFELTYESGNIKLINSSKCRYAFNLYAEKRNPGSGNLQCYDGVKHQYYQCPCKDGDMKCRTEEKWAHEEFLCPIIKVNGIQIQGKRQTVFTDPNNQKYNWTKIDVDCYKAEGGTVSFWGYSKPDTKEIIRVDEVHCLMDDAVAEVPKRFKSLQAEEQQPMKLSPSPLLANNASSLIHVFVGNP